MVVRADGLSTSFADVQLEGVPVGVEYSVASSEGEGLILRNTGASPLRIRIEILKPSKNDLRGGAEAIPDVAWIKVAPDNLEIPAHGQSRCRLTLVVPREENYRHKYFQATIWSHSVPFPGQGVAINAGLLSRLRFKTQ